MKVIITENQLFIFRRIQEFIDIVEDQIKGYEKQGDNAWWCRNNNPEDFLQHRGSIITMIQPQSPENSSLHL